MTEEMEISRSHKVWEINFQITFRVPSIKVSIEIEFSSVFDKHTTNNNKKEYIQNEVLQDFSDYSSPCVSNYGKPPCIN